MNLQSLIPFMGDLNKLSSMGKADKKEEYVQPALTELGIVTIPIIREIISPASFRNEENEVTEITVHGKRRVRATANKFKYPERKQNLQILRLMNAGGKQAQNRTYILENGKPSDAFDLGSMIFGDSVNKPGRVYPVKAGFEYTDAPSISLYSESVDSTFHIRASEDGSLWDSSKGQNTDNLFERHFIVPGTLLFQNIVSRGKTVPFESLEHLLLSIGFCGAYGGGTSVYSINSKNHIVGIYAGKFEKPISSPYEALKLADFSGGEDIEIVKQKMHELFSESYPVSVPGEAVSEEIAYMMEKVENDDIDFKQKYENTAEKVAEFFDGWFGS